MTKMDDVLAKAVEAGDVPFAVAMAGNAAGITYSGAAGQAAAGRSAAEDTTFRIFSMTKGIGSLAAMILIDRGRISMDTPVAEILPEWNDLQVLEGWEGDRPLLRSPKTTATLRHLATHTSGLQYELWSHDMAKYLEVTGAAPILSGLKAGLAYPLMSDPGTCWGYGTGIDWLGRAVEAVDGRRIDAFCQAEVFDPLGMTSTAFEPDRLADRLAEVFIRGEDGTLGSFELAPPPKPEVYGMGHALYSTAPDYMKFLRMMLNKGALEGNRVLSEAAVADMLADQMQGLTFQRMVTAAPPVTADVILPEGTTHSFGFVRVEADVPGRRRAGSQSWAGLCNTHYWFDPASDVAAVIMTQSLPFVEEPYMRTYEAYEEAVYAS
ncbi:serine hydrolase [Pelagibius sp. Alg239-R121]|uniref:serine hydrolase domain-containing protein n=1 Tax=Pelagibius sp. Alg239-R121 TaxID=2993448 RepID=UPI0024A700D7|nr:serine hydrolase domain-containing protein [Pelagibius sp. Alg239-R121]